MNKGALHKFTYGLYIISSEKEGHPNGQIANVAFQVTANPVQIAIALHKDNLTCQYVKDTGMFSVSVLDTTADIMFIGRFGFRSGRDFQKFDDTINWKKGETLGMPIILDHTVAYAEAKVVSSLDLGTHILFIGQIIDADIVGDGTPLTYDYYHNVIKGKEPPKAPTFTG